MKKLTTYRYDAKETYDIRNCAKLYLEFETVCKNTIKTDHELLKIKAP